MSPKTKEQNEKIRQEKRRLILDKALEVFGTYGYHDASISIIAQKAGIAKGSIYEYFLSKEELLKTVVQEGFKDFIDIFTELFDSKILEASLTPENFRKFIIKVFEVISDNKDFWRLYMAIALQPGVMEILIKDYEGFMFSQLHFLEQYYQMQDSKNPRGDALHTTILIDGIILNYFQPHKEYSREELERLIQGLERPIY